MVDERKGRQPTYGDRNDRRRTTPRGVPIVPPPPRSIFEDGTPPSMDPSTWHALVEIRAEQDVKHLQVRGEILEVRKDVSTLAVRHAEVGADVRTLLDDRTEERKERCARIAFWRGVTLKVLGGLFSGGVILAVIHWAGC